MWPLSGTAISCSSASVTSVISSFLLRQIYLIAQTKFQRAPTAIVKNPGSNCQWIWWSLTWGLTLSYCPHLVRAGNRHFSLFLNENSKFNPSSNCCQPHLMHKAGCFQLGVVLQEENENCNQMLMGRQRTKGGKECSGSRLKGITVQQKEIGVLHWKQKRDLCFVGSQQKIKMH